MTAWERDRLEVEEEGLEYDRKPAENVEMIDVHEYYDIEPERLIKVKSPANEIVYIDGDDFDELLSTCKVELPFFFRVFDEKGRILATMRTEDLVAFMFE